MNKPEVVESATGVKDVSPNNLFGNLLVVAATVASLIGFITLGNSNALGAELSKTATAIEVAKDMYQQADGNFLEWKTNLENCESGSLAKILGCSHQEKMMNDFGNEMAYHLTKLEEFVGYQEKLLAEKNQGLLSGFSLLVIGALLLTFGLLKRRSSRKLLKA